MELDEGYGGSYLGQNYLLGVTDVGKCLYMAECIILVFVAIIPIFANGITLADT